MKSQYFSKENTDCLKGILALVVLAHHLYQDSGILRGNPLGFLFQSLGFLGVAGFFFLSGYGLAVSFSRKGDAYIKDFPRNRILPFYCICCVLIVMYTLFWNLIGQTPNLGYFLKSFAWGGTVIANGWYLQTSLLLYLFFYVCFSFGKTNKTRILFLTFAVLLYCLFCYTFSFPVSWYITTPTFLLGIVCGTCNEKITGIFSSLSFKKHSILLVVGTLIFLVLWCFRIVVSWLPNILDMLFRAVACCFFALACMLFIAIVPIKNRITTFLGNISLEIYVAQGFFLELYHTTFLNIETPWIYISAVIISTFIFSIMLHPLFTHITRCLKPKNI